MTMIGDGPLLNPCRQLVQALGLQGVIEFMGPQVPDVVAARMRKARAFVQHSVRAMNGDSEGTPVAVIEAQASGLPVVATRHAGIRDVVLDGDTGVLVDELDLDGMAEGMIRLVRDSEVAGRMGRAGRQNAIDRFSLPASIKQLATVIERAMKATALPKSVITSGAQWSVG